MADIIGYSRAVDTETGSVVKLFMRGTPRYVAGSRFKYTPDVIDFSYENLVSAICEAIDKQAEEEGNVNFTTERNNVYIESKELDFDELTTAFQDMIEMLMSNSEEDTFRTFWQPRIVQITDKYLGRGCKVSQCSREQTEALDLIVTELRDLIKANTAE